MAKIHIVATRVDNVVTNYGIATVEYGPDKASARDYLQVTRFITNTTIQTIATNTIVPGPTLQSGSYSNVLVTTNVTIGPVSPNSTLKFQATSGTNKYDLSLASNLLTIASTSSTQTMFSATQAPPAATNSSVNSIITTTIITQTPMITTNYTYSIAVNSFYCADKRQMFLLTPNQDVLHDDVGSIFVDGNGLLSTLNATNTDQTLAAIAQLAIAAAQAFELISSGGLAVPSLPLARALEEEVLFKPTDFTNVNALVPTLLDKAKTDRIHMKLSDAEYAKLNASWEAFLAKNPKTAADVFEVQTTLSTIFDEIISSRALDYLALVTSPAQTRPELGIVHYLSLEWPTLSELGLLEQRMLLEDAFKYLAREQVVEPVDWARFVQKLILAARQNQPPPQKLDLVFDPFDPVELAKARELLRPAHIDILNADEFTQSAAVYPHLMEADSKKASGIFYRVPMPYEIVLGDNYSNVVSTPVLLPNKSPTLNLELKKGLFVSSSSQVVLTNGCIYSYSFSKPSTVMAAATLPLTIISGVSSSLTNLLQLRINLGTGQNSLQNTLYSQQAAANNARLAQQATDITSLSNAITIYNASRALNSLTNNTSQRH